LHDHGQCLPTPKNVMHPDGRDGAIKCNPARLPPIEYRSRHKVSLHKSYGINRAALVIGPALAVSYTVKRRAQSLPLFQFTGKPCADKPREFEGRALNIFSSRQRTVPFQVSAPAWCFPWNGEKLPCYSICCRTDNIDSGHFVQ
jgi:hypothetical protein